MARYRGALPQIEKGPFLHYVGMDTDLIFTRGIELPGFASYPLLESEKGRALLRGYCDRLLDLGRETRVGIILDTSSWVANRDRGAAIGFDPEKLRDLNRASVDLVARAREAGGDLPTVLCAQMGPRGDGYAAGDRMTVEEAEAYHSEQMQTLARSEADFVGGFTLCYPEEAIGMVRAGQRFDMPVAISFTVETDGRLPTGLPLPEAIQAVDNATNSGAVYFLVNCAHPDHIDKALTAEPWIARLKGVVVNASRCSHSELDEAVELDDGDPDELGRLSGRLRQSFPHFTVFGGCCGTDMRHMRLIAEQVRGSSA